MLEAVRALRYATIAQLADYLGQPKQNIAKRLRRSNIRQFKYQGMSVFTLEPKDPKHIEHELLVTDALLRARPAIIYRTGIQTPDINPDALYQSGGWYYLEVENGAGHHSVPDLLKKCWQYLSHSRAGGFRVRFDLPSEHQAKELCEAIKSSGITHLGKFLVSWRGEDAVSPNGASYSVSQTRPTPGRENREISE